MEGMKNFPMYTNGSSPAELLWFPGEGGPYPDSIHIFPGVTSPLPDGVLFSGGQTAGNRDIVNFTDSELMMRHGVMWPITEVKAGQYLQINWLRTVPHATRGYRYFITRDGWDPTQRATRGDFERAPFASVINMTGPLDIIPDQTIKLPSNKKGHHIILAIWMVADTGAGFYSAFDVEFTEGGDGGDGGGDGGGGEIGSRDNPAPWSYHNVRYPVGFYVTHNGGLFRCRTEHISNRGWAPGVAFTLWDPVND